MITWMLNPGMNSKCYLIFEVFFSFFTKETGKLGNLTFISYHLKKILLVVKIITLDFLPFAFIFTLKIILLWKSAYGRLKPFFNRIYNQDLCKHLKNVLISLLFPPSPGSLLTSSTSFLSSDNIQLHLLIFLYVLCSYWHLVLLTEREKLHKPDCLRMSNIPEFFRA